jgi:hypothetical protein
MIYSETIEPISGKNLSQAWAKALMKCNDSRGGIVSPAIVHFPVGESHVLV